MRVVGLLMLTMCALAALSLAGCGGEGYTPVCEEDASNCLEKAKGGTAVEPPDGGGNPD